MIKTYVALALTGTVALVIGYGTLSPPGDGSPLPFTDKQLHFAAFVALVLPLAWIRPMWITRLVLLALLYGAAIELIQPYVGRSGDWGDLLADALGIAAGTTPAWIRR